MSSHPPSRDPQARAYIFYIIPICLFVDSASGLDCDVSVENPLAARNTALLHTCVLFVEQTTLRDHVSRG